MLRMRNVRARDRASLERERAQEAHLAAGGEPGEPEEADLGHRT
jgi:hypothetical protein